MKIKVTGNRKPFIDGTGRKAGYEATVDADLGKHLIANKLAVEIKSAPKKDAPKASLI